MEIKKFKDLSKILENKIPKRIPILPESEFYSNTDQKEPILNLAWHLLSEARSNLEKNGYLGDVIDVKEATFLG